MPIVLGGRVEGCLGILRRTVTPYGPAAMAVIHALCAVYAAESAVRRDGGRRELPAGHTADR